jgi:hypothetical protein
MVMDDNEINDNKKFRQITGHFEWSTFWALLEATGCQHQESDHTNCRVLPWLTIFTENTKH